MIVRFSAWRSLGRSMIAEMRSLCGSGARAAGAGERAQRRRSMMRPAAIVASELIS